MREKRTKVNCDVENCYYNSEEGDCTLEELKISSSVEGDECRETSSTLCESFESSGGIITDNEYEVNSENEEKKD